MNEYIKLSLSPRNEVVEIVVQVSHPMEASGGFQPTTGKAIPGDFLQTIAIQLNEKTLLEGQTGSLLAKNPVFKFAFKGVKEGDKFLVFCTDSKGRKFEQGIVVPIFRNE